MQNRKWSDMTKIESIKHKHKTKTKNIFMNHKSIMLAALAGAILATGCKPSDTADENRSDGTNVTSTSENLKAGATNAWANTKYAVTNTWADFTESLGASQDYPYDKKAAFVTSAQTDLNALDQKIQALPVNPDATLRDKRAALDQKLSDVENATPDNWDNAKTAFENSYAEVKGSVKQDWDGSVTNSVTSSQ
jgi:hypothetical protein